VSHKNDHAASLIIKVFLYTKCAMGTVAVRKKCKLLYNFCAIVLDELNKLCTTTDAVFITSICKIYGEGPNLTYTISLLPSWTK
jgi:hypothetical protein